MPGTNPNDILAQMGLDLSSFEAGLLRVTTRIDGLDTHFQKANTGLKNIEKSGNIAARTMGSFRNVLGVLGVTLSGAGIAAFAKSIISFGSDLVDTSRVTNTSVEGLQRLTGAFSKVGVSAEDTKSALHTVAQLLRSVREGTPEEARTAAISLDQLGVSGKEMEDKLVGSDKVLLTITQHLHDMGEGSVAANTASTVFGADLKNKLAPAIEVGRAKIEELEKQIKTIPAATALAAKMADEKLSQWGRSFKIWSTNAIVDIAKVIEKLKLVEQAQHDATVGLLPARIKRQDDLIKERQESALKMKPNSPEQKSAIDEIMGMLRLRNKMMDQLEGRKEKAGDAGTKVEEVKATQDQAKAEEDVTEQKHEQAKTGEAIATATDKVTRKTEEQKGTIMALVRASDSYLAAQERIANQLEPERIKNIQRLVALHDKLVEDLAFEESKGKGASDRELTRLRTQIALNNEQQRNARVALRLLSPHERAEQRREENRVRRAQRTVSAQDRNRALAESVGPSGGSALSREESRRRYGGAYDPHRRDDARLKRDSGQNVQSITATTIFVSQLQPR